MAWSHNIAKYPAALLRIAELRVEQLPFHIPCDSVKAARHLRFKLYGLTEAMRANKHPGVIAMDAFEITVEGQEVVIVNRDLQYAVIDRLLDQPPPTPSPSTAPPPPSHETFLEGYLGVSPAKAVPERKE